MQTKEEQEMLLAKIQSNIQPKSATVQKQAAFDAGYVDFSKPIDELEL